MIHMAVRNVLRGRVMAATNKPMHSHSPAVTAMRIRESERCSRNRLLKSVMVRSPQAARVRDRPVESHSCGTAWLSHCSSQPAEVALMRKVTINQAAKRMYRRWR